MTVTSRQYLLVSFIFFLFACKQNEASKNLKTEQVQIVIQPFDDLDKSMSDYVFKRIQEVYPKVILSEKVPLPSQAFYEPRNRFKADSILKYFNRLPTTNKVFIGLTSKDISTRKGKVDDFGVMGLVNCPGKSCVASTFRLAKNNKKEQLFKVAIHELGHTQGLPHCKKKYCFMRDAEGKNPTNEEKEFCEKCKLHLIGKGFQL